MATAFDGLEYADDFTIVLEDNPEGVVANLVDIGDGDPDTYGELTIDINPGPAALPIDVIVQVGFTTTFSIPSNGVEFVNIFEYDLASDFTGGVGITAILHAAWTFTGGPPLTYFKFPATVNYSYTDETDSVAVGKVEYKVNVPGGVDTTNIYAQFTLQGTSGSATDTMTGGFKIYESRIQSIRNQFSGLVAG